MKFVIKNEIKLNKSGTQSNFYNQHKKFDVKTLEKEKKI